MKKRGRKREKEWEREKRKREDGGKGWREREGKREMGEREREKEREREREEEGRGSDRERLCKLGRHTKNAKRRRNMFFIYAKNWMFHKIFFPSISSSYLVNLVKMMKFEPKFVSFSLLNYTKLAYKIE